MATRNPRARRTCTTDLGVATFLSFGARRRPRLLGAAVFLWCPALCYGTAPPREHTRREHNSQSAAVPHTRRLARRQPPGGMTNGNPG